MLAVSTGAFTVFFAVWVMFAVIGIPLRAELGLTEGQFAMLVAIPILVGAVFRVPLGMLTDALGGRLTMTALLVATAVPTALVAWAQSYGQLLVLGALIGFAGSSFAVGIAWVSAWFPYARQGMALGTFGTGNVGASITKMLAPTLVTAVGVGGLMGGLIPGGWRFVPIVYALMLLATAAVVWTVSPKNDHRPAHGRTLRSMLEPLRYVRVWRFGLYYMVVFGAYVALALWLPKYYVDVYEVTLAQAGLLTALFIFPASLLRPLGGWLADRHGARRITYVAFGTIIATCLALARPTEIGLFTALVVVVGVAMGIGKASVYKYVPQYFPRDVGVVGGLIGAVGALAGFILPLTFVAITARTGEPESIFHTLTILTVICTIWLTAVVVHSSDHDQGVI